MLCCGEVCVAVQAFASFCGLLCALPSWAEREREKRITLVVDLHHFSCLGFSLTGSWNPTVSYNGFSQCRSLGRSLDLCAEAEA